MMEREIERRKEEGRKDASWLLPTIRSGFEGDSKHEEEGGKGRPVWPFFKVSTKKSTQISFPRDTA